MQFKRETIYLPEVNFRRWAYKTNIIAFSVLINHLLNIFRPIFELVKKINSITALYLSLALIHHLCSYRLRNSFVGKNLNEEKKLRLIFF